MNRLLLSVLSIFIFLTSCQTKGTSISIDNAELKFKGIDEATQEIAVASSEDWDVAVAEAAKSWITAEKADASTLKVRVADNSTGKVRKGKITLRQTSTPEIVTVLTVTQDIIYNYHIECDPIRLFFDAADPQKQIIKVSVTGGESEWIINAPDALKKWADINVNGDQIEITAHENTETETRSGHIEISTVEKPVRSTPLFIEQGGVVSFDVSLPKELQDNILYIDQTQVKDYIVTINKITGSEWNISATYDNADTTDWLFIFKNSDTAVLRTFQNSTFKDRECTVTVICEKDTTKNISFKVIQKA